MSLLSVISRCLRGTYIRSGCKKFQVCYPRNSMHPDDVQVKNLYSHRQSA